MKRERSLRWARRRVADWLTDRSDLTELIEAGDLSLHVDRDGEGCENFAFWLTADQEAPEGVRTDFEEVTTSYVHASGYVEAYF